jgi:hypothetical protein
VPTIDLLQQTFNCHHQLEPTSGRMLGPEQRSDGSGASGAAAAGRPSRADVPGCGRSVLTDGVLGCRPRSWLLVGDADARQCATRSSKVRFQILLSSLLRRRDSHEARRRLVGRVQLNMRLNLKSELVHYASNSLFISDFRARSSLRLKELP